MKQKLAVLLVIAAAWTGAALAQAQDKPPEKPADKPAADAPKKEPPKAEQSVTQHSVVIGGAPVAYTATAGTLIVRNDKDEPWASIGYTAYVKNDAGGCRPPADHVRLQRRAGILLDLAAHGCARAPAHRDDRRRADATAALPARRQRLQPARQDRPRDDRPGRHGPLPGRR